MSTLHLTLKKKWFDMMLSGKDRRVPRNQALLDKAVLFKEVSLHNLP